jgi:hypothetical protein
MDTLDRIPAPTPDPTMASNDRAIFPCGCGMWRSLPANIRVGETTQLVPCPRCGAAPKLKFHGAAVEEIYP